MSVHRLKALITIEQVNTTEWSGKKEESYLTKLQWLGVVDFQCMQNYESCDEDAVYFRQ